MSKCVVCVERKAVGLSLCGPCGRSFDRFVERGGSGACLDAIEWAAKRARLFERRRRA